MGERHLTAHLKMGPSNAAGACSGSRGCYISGSAGCLIHDMQLVMGGFAAIQYTFAILPTRAHRLLVIFISLGLWLVSIFLPAVQFHENPGLDLGAHH